MSKQEALKDDKKHIPKQKSKMGKMFSRFGKKASQAMAKGAVKLRVKMAGDGSPIDPQVEKALAQLKSTKNEIYFLSDTISNLYDANVSQATYLTQLANKLVGLNQDDPNDGFNKYLIEMGKVYLKLENVISKHLEKMEELFLGSMTKFRDTAIDGAQKLKLKWKTSKAAYDGTLKQIKKAKEKGDFAKEAEYTGKRDAALKELNIIRKALCDSVDMIIKSKNTDLMPKYQQYHNEMITFVNAEAQVLNQNPINFNGGQQQQIIQQQQPPPQQYQQQQQPVQQQQQIRQQQQQPIQQQQQQNINNNNGMPPPQYQQAMNIQQQQQQQPPPQPYSTQGYPNTNNNNNGGGNGGGGMPPPAPDQAYGNENEIKQEDDAWNNKPDSDNESSAEIPNNNNNNYQQQPPTYDDYSNNNVKQDGLLPDLNKEYNNAKGKSLLALNVSKVNGYTSPIPAILVHMMQRLEMLSYSDIENIFNIPYMQTQLNNDDDDDDSPNNNMNKEAFQICMNLIDILINMPKPLLIEIPDKLISKATSKDEMTQVILMMDEPFASILTFLWDILAKVSKNEDETEMNAAKIAKVFGPICSVKCKIDSKGNIVCNDIMKMSKMIAFFQRGLQWREDLIANV